jgi:hypothetical protein
MQNMTQLIHAMLHAGLKLPTLEAATTLAEAAVVAAGHDRHVARLLAEVSSFTVDGALLLPPNSNNFFGASYAPANCSNNKACGNTGNGPMVRETVHRVSHCTDSAMPPPCACAFMKTNRTVWWAVIHSSCKRRHDV